MGFSMENKMPFELKEKIKAEIHQKLNPPWTKVFFKLTMIQFVTSFFVLIICPQFNLGFFPHSPLGHLLMSFGDIACNLACGAIFLGTGTFFAILFMTADELRVLRPKSIISHLLLGMIALLSFMVFGVEFQFLLFGAWLLGAVVTSKVSLEIYFYRQI